MSMVELESLSFTTIPFRQILVADDRRERLLDCMRTTPHDTHLRQSSSRHKRLEQPEDPVHQRGHIDEEFAILRLGELMVE